MSSVISLGQRYYPFNGRALLLTTGCCERILFIRGLMLWDPDYGNGPWELTCDKLHTNEKSCCQPAGKMDSSLLGLGCQTKTKERNWGVKNHKEELLGNTLQSKTNLRNIFGK